jgi:hypothetical protein
LSHHPSTWPRVAGRMRVREASGRREAVRRPAFPAFSRQNLVPFTTPLFCEFCTAHSCVGSRTGPNTIPRLSCLCRVASVSGYIVRRCFLVPRKFVSLLKMVVITASFWHRDSFKFKSICAALRARASTVMAAAATRPDDGHASTLQGARALTIVFCIQSGRQNAVSPTSQPSALRTPSPQRSPGPSAPALRRKA